MADSPLTALAEQALSQIASKNPAFLLGLLIDSDQIIRKSPNRGASAGTPSPLASSSPTSMLQGSRGSLDNLAITQALQQAVGPRPGGPGSLPPGAAGPIAPGAGIPGGGGMLGRPPIAPSSVPGGAVPPLPTGGQGGAIATLLQQLAARQGLGGLVGSV